MGGRSGESHDGGFAARSFPRSVPLSRWLPARYPSIKPGNGSVPFKGEEPSKLQATSHKPQLPSARREVEPAPSALEEHVHLGQPVLDDVEIDVLLRLHSQRPALEHRER